MRIESSNDNQRLEIRQTVRNLESHLNRGPYTLTAAGSKVPCRGKRTMWAKKAQRWRTKNKRGVSPIIATILLVAITVVLAAVLYVLISGLIHGPGNTPIGSAMSMGGATATSVNTVGINAFGAVAAPGCAEIVTVTTYYCYSVTIASVSNGVTFGSIQAQIITSTGGVYAATGIDITSLSGQVLAFGTGGSVTAWTTENGATATTQLVSSDTIWVETGVASQAGLGDSLTIFGVGSYSGSISTGLP